METNGKKLSIRDWPEDDRPREKVLRNGVSSLSKSELLAILIGSGNAEESAVELMKKVLASCNDSIAELSKLTVDELCSFKGIGSAKAITIIAACELWKRRKEDDRDDHFVVRTSQDVYDYFYPLLCDLVIEECHVLLLNNMNRVIDSVKVGSGGYTGTMVDIRYVLREALLKRATGLVLCHNHPSGSLKPSNEDDKLTRSMAAACSVMNIRFLDHIIFTDRRFFSYKDEGRL
ncbi:MAG: DNA repair protein RadC [Bacteroidaceae bacterium]|nr:DNA repair protein RadC [Bacteroidaceae bacterium]MBR5848248.1 DNA repair protein RadC [Bacteroidaceae bacterium]